MAEIQYGGTRIKFDLTYEGAEIHWHETTAADLERFLPKIRGWADLLGKTYRVQFHDDDTAHLMLDIEFKGESTRVMRQRLKADVNAVVTDTDWGGSG